MKFKDYLNSLVSKRKGSTSSSKSHQKPINTKNHQGSTVSTDCHYDICGYEDINGHATDDQHSRTQILLARHAQLVNTIVGTRSSHENIFPSCTQCRISHQSSSSMISPPPTSMPPPLPPKLSLEHQMSFSNHNYSSTLATCSPRRECQQHSCHPTHLIASQYSTPNPNVMSSSSNSLWTTVTATASLSKKQRSRIRTNPWIGTTPTNNRSSICVEPSNTYQYQILPSSITPFSQPEYGIYDPTYRTSPLGLIHSESFPQTILNGNAHLINLPPPPPTPVPVPAPTSSVILHQSDSGHGFSLSSSRVIDSSSSPSSSSSSSSSSHPSSSSSSSPDNTSSDGLLLNDKQHYRQKKLKRKISSPSSSVKKDPPQHTNPEQHFVSNTISSDSGSLTRRKKTHQVSSPVTLQYRYQRPSNTTKTTSPVKSPMDRIHQQHHSQSSSSRSIDDHFSVEFEEILENERSYKQRKDKQSSTRLVSPTSLSPRKSPFILPLDDTNMKLSSPPPPPLIFSPTLTKTNSRAILKHIEEIENEIRLIKNLDLANNDDDDEYVLSPHAYPEEDIDLGDDIDDNKDEEKIKDNRESIYEQVDQWVEKCLNTSKNSGNRLHAECDHLSNTIKDYVGCICSNNDQQTSSIPAPSAELMTAFYLSSTPTRITKRTSSFIDQPLKLENTETSHLKSIHECPF